MTPPSSTKKMLLLPLKLLKIMKVPLNLKSKLLKWKSLLKPMTMTELKPKPKPFWFSSTPNRTTLNHLMMDLLKNYSPLSKEDLTKSTLKL